MMQKHLIAILFSILLCSSCRTMDNYEKSVVEDSKKPDAKIELVQTEYEHTMKHGSGINATKTSSIETVTRVTNKSMNKSCSLRDVKELKTLLPGNAASLKYVNKYASNRKKYKIVLLASVATFVGGLFILGAGHPADYDTRGPYNPYKPSLVFGGAALSFVSAVSVFTQIPLRFRNEKNLFKAVDAYNKN